MTQKQPILFILVRMYQTERINISTKHEKSRFYSVLREVCLVLPLTYTFDVYYSEFP